MNLIDRYLHEVGRHLPRRRRDDILAELRSSLLDRLEDIGGDQPKETDVVTLLQEMGRPRDVAASYYPEGQYLIGPTLFPLFKTVATVAVLASMGAQLIAWLVAVFIAGEGLNALDTLLGILNSVPITLGIVVIVFAILQRLEVRPEAEKEAWDPRQLPEPALGTPVKRGERAAGIVVGIVLLAIITTYADKIGIYSLTEDGVSFWANPVLADYLVWISFSIVIGIGVDLYLLWRGVWDTAGRLAKIGSNAISLLILSLLYQAHSEWLAARGVGTLLSSLDQLGNNGDLLTQATGMQLFRMGIGVALVVVAIETVVMLARLIYAQFSQGDSPAPLVLKKG